MRPQTRHCQEHASLVGSRHVKVDSRAILAAQRQSFDRQVREWYRNECLPVFFCSNTETKDRFYGKSLVAPGRQPRIPKSGGLDVSTSHRLPYLKLGSAPVMRPNDVESVVATVFESNNCRTLAENVCLRVFHALPYGTANMIARQNEQIFFNQHAISRKETGFSSLFPQGTVVLCHDKTLHDDANGVVIPGFWQCIREDPINPVTLQFITVSAGWKMSSDRGRFALFKGLIPRCTRLTNGLLVPSTIQRVSHSSYWKLGHEYLSLVLLSPENCKKIVVAT